ncbi:MAG: hypothetical protein ACJ79E_03900 [Anaeromyxobacteraceae bacterium]
MDRTRSPQEIAAVKRATLALALLAAAASARGAPPAGGAAAPDPALADARAAEVVTALRDDRSVRVAKAFAPALHAELPPPRITAALRKVAAALGALTGASPDAAARTATHRAYDLAFERGRLRLDLDFSADGQVTAFALHPPLGAAEPVRGARAAEVAVGHPPLLLRGTLVVPQGAAKVAAALLLPDAGADRDGARGKDPRPLRDLAEALAARGIASLRLERRSALYPDAAAQGTPDSDVVEDALAALRLLGATPEVDPARLVVVGHGLGGVLAPDLAARAAPSGPVAALAIVGAPSQALPLAFADAARASKALAPGDLAREEALAERAFSGRLEDDELFHGHGRAFWRDLRGRDPAKHLRRLGIPVLFAAGERDLVAGPEDQRMWAGTLQGVEGVTFTSLGAVDHDLVASGDRAAPGALKVLVEFVAAVPARATAKPISTSNATPTATPTSTVKPPRSP